MQKRMSTSPELCEYHSHAMGAGCMHAAYWAKSMEPSQAPIIDLVRNETKGIRAEKRVV